MIFTLITIIGLLLGFILDRHYHIGSAPLYFMLGYITAAASLTCLIIKLTK